MSYLNGKTLKELITMLKKGEISPPDIVRDIGAALDEDGKAELPLNAYITFDADEIVKTMGHGDFSERPLHGVPVAVKDLINVRGARTTCGSKMLRDYVSPYDATAIEYLRERGGIPAGKLNMGLILAPADWKPVYSVKQ